jgi:hypothetical protein
VGLDCEWKPVRSRWATSKVAVLQLCPATPCLVFQLFYATSIPASLRSFLADPEVRFVGVGVREDVAKLVNDYGLTKTRDARVVPRAARENPSRHLHSPPSPLSPTSPLPERAAGIKLCACR